MAKLYFMHREFEGLCLSLDEAIENDEIQLLFSDSWYWLHYRFFRRDIMCSESSSVVRTHLYNLAAYLYRDLESLPKKIHKTQSDIQKIILELVDIAEYSKEAEYSKNYPFCVWIFGDTHSKLRLEETLNKLPTAEQADELLWLPHFRKLENERLGYAFNSDEAALKRYRNEEAAFNKRQKQL
jgi:hypothetical protein